MWRTCLLQDRWKAYFFFWQSPILLWLPMVVGRLVKHDRGVGRKIERVQSLVDRDYGNWFGCAAGEKRGKEERGGEG